MEPHSSQPLRRVSLLNGFSIEATRPKAQDFEALKASAPPGTLLYLSALPAYPPGDLIGYSASAVAAGLVPIPHIAARTLSGMGELETLLNGLVRNGVRRALLIGGERDRPLGPFGDAFELLSSGVLQRCGIAGVDIGGYPEGHPRIETAKLEAALIAKVDLAKQIGLAPRIVTQFSFDAGTITDWILHVRQLGIDVPLRIGLAGPASIGALIRYAQRCGVRASAGAMMRNSNLVKGLAARTGPDDIIASLSVAAAKDDLGEIGIHLFSFGGIGATARWAMETAPRIISDNKLSAIGEVQCE